MDLAEIEKKISGIDDFIEKAERIGFYIEVRDRGKIEKTYKGRLSEALTALFNLICNLPFKDFSIVLRKKEKLISWYSTYSHAVVINLAFNPSSLEFNSKVQEIVGKAQQIEKEAKS